MDPTPRRLEHRSIKEQTRMSRSEGWPKKSCPHHIGFRFQRSRSGAGRRNRPDAQRNGFRRMGRRPSLWCTSCDGRLRSLPAIPVRPRAVVPAEKSGRMDVKVIAFDMPSIRRPTDDDTKQPVTETGIRRATDIGTHVAFARCLSNDKLPLMFAVKCPHVSWMRGASIARSPGHEAPRKSTSFAPVNFRCSKIGAGPGVSQRPPAIIDAPDIPGSRGPAWSGLAGA